MKHRTFCSLFVITLIFMLFAIQTAAAESGVYVGVLGGYVFKPDVTLQGNGGSLDLGTKGTGMFGVKVGYTPPAAKFFSAEIEYSYLKPKLEGIDTDGDPYSGDITLHNFFLNLIVRYPEGKIHPYAGGGVGIAHSKFSVDSITTVGDPSRSADSFAWQLLAGVEYVVTNNILLDLGYRYFGTKPDLGDGIKADFRTSMVAFGIKYLF